MDLVPLWQLRAQFAKRLSVMYGKEVPAYNTLLDVSQQVNRDAQADRGRDVERLGSFDRITAERHGAIRVGTPMEIRQVATVFAGFGMFPVGFYDLREGASSAVPVVSTAFRPTDPEQLALNPFRVFTSLLVPADRRFFSADLQQRVDNFLSTRELFGPELLALAERSAQQDGLSNTDADLFLALATSAFELSREPVDRAWYEELHTVSSVAADIAGVKGTHINHLTPRVIDIDDLYQRMSDLGVEMIDAIQGPPSWKGPDLLLRQTSFRALAENRVFAEPDGTTKSGHLRVRFGEVEARGIAVTPAGRALYDELLADVEKAAMVQASGHRVTKAERNDIAATIWNEKVPTTESGLAAGGLAYFTYAVNPDADQSTITPEARLSDLIARNVVIPEPIVYEDFLPKSAAGIFQSNLTSDGRKDNTQARPAIDAAWMEGALARPLHDPYELYESISAASRAKLRTALNIPLEP